MTDSIQLIRGKVLKSFIPSSRGVSAREAIRRAGEAGMVIASNTTIHMLLNGSARWREMKELFPCWTGTMTAYAEPGKAFNKSKIFSKELNALVYADPGSNERWIFPIGHYGNEKNAVLVSEHPDYSLDVDKKEILVRPSVVGIVQNFPEGNWCFSRNGQYCIPTTKASGLTMRLERSDCRVGPIVRGANNVEYAYNHIHLNYAPSAAFGVAVEGQLRKHA
jgi:hypothetical protein